MVASRIGAAEHRVEISAGMNDMQDQDVRPLDLVYDQVALCGAGSLPCDYALPTVQISAPIRIAHGEATASMVGSDGFEPPTLSV